MAAAFNPYAVILARRAKGMSQTDLATAVGVSQAAVSQWEKGHHVPESDVLTRIAVVLDVLPHALVDDSVVPTTPLFRAAGIKSRKDEYRIAGRTELARLAASRILAELEVEATLPWPSTDDPLDNMPEAAAEALRRVWRIPPGPIANLTKYVEAAGAIVLRVDFGQPKVEAAYAHHRQDRVRWLLMNTHGNDWARQRLTLAHELGHAVLHHWDAFNAGPNRLRETQAFAFALALMVPAPDFIMDIAHTGRRWDDFLRLRAKWGVSAAALARRARDLGLLEPNAYRSVNITRRNRGHWNQEPGDDDPLERPTIFPEAVALLRDDAGWTNEMFSEIAGLPYRRLSELLPDDFPPAGEPAGIVRLRRVK